MLTTPVLALITPAPEIENVPPPTPVIVGVGLGSVVQNNAAA